MGLDRNRRRCQRIGIRGALSLRRVSGIAGRGMAPRVPNSSSETSVHRGFGDAHLGRVIPLFARDGRARDGPHPLRLARGAARCGVMGAPTRHSHARARAAGSPRHRLCIGFPILRRPD